MTNHPNRSKKSRTDALYLSLVTSEPTGRPLRDTAGNVLRGGEVEWKSYKFAPAEAVASLIAPLRARLRSAGPVKIVDFGTGWAALECAGEHALLAIHSGDLGDGRQGYYASIASSDWRPGAINKLQAQRLAASELGAR